MVAYSAVSYYFLHRRSAFMMFGSSGGGLLMHGCLLLLCSGKCTGGGCEQDGGCDAFDGTHMYSFFGERWIRAYK